MINKISSNLTKKLITNNIIAKDEQELYRYGVFLMTSHIFFIVLTITIGVLFSCLVESIIFYVSFHLLRAYVGGYHATTETKCEIISSLSIFLCISIIKISSLYNKLQMVLLCFTIFFAIIIFIFTPLDTPEKKLTLKEFKQFKRISRIILLIMLLFIVSSYYYKISIVFLPCAVGLMLEAVLLLIGKIKK